MPARDNESLRTFILPGLLALGREAPRRRPVLAALGAAAMWVVDRIHRDAAVMRHAALTALPASCARSSLPSAVFILSGLETPPTVAMHRPCTRRCSDVLSRRIT